VLVLEITKISQWLQKPFGLSSLCHPGSQIRRASKGND